MYFYTTYGLAVCSAFPLPELIASVKVKAAVRIRLSQFAGSLPETNAEGMYAQISVNEAYLFWDQIGMFSVRGGKEISIEPLPGYRII